MTNLSGRRGTEAENGVVAVFRRRFPAADRRVPNGSLDRGDVTGVPELCVEVKGGKGGYDLGPWMKEAEKEQVNAKTRWKCLAFRRWGKGNPEEWFATMRLGDFVDLYADLMEMRSR